MKVVIGSDHAGFSLKQWLIQVLAELNYDIADEGTYDESSVDYPDFAKKVALKVAEQDIKGILICGSGVGATVAANKIKGVRACVCHDTYSAHQGVEHDDMNILVLGSRIIGIELARELATTFLSARFSKEERHTRRLNKVKAFEEEFGESK